MPRRIQDYRSDDIEVTFDPNICIHAARCLMLLPEVFDVSRRKWVTPESASADDVARTIERCPSGALRYHRLDGAPDEVPDAEPSVRTQRDGPLMARGDITIHNATGAVLALGPRFALCRCGNSQNKPFCDNTHRAIAFRAP
jgi:uncharacterized Fe-S cluster protein YjdI